MTVALTPGLTAVPAQATATEVSRSTADLDQELDVLKSQILLPAAAGSPSLRKVPGASPAVTISRFLALTGKAETTIRAAVRRGLAEPGPFFSQQVHREVDGAVLDLLEATQALDLSRMPAALRPMTGVGTMLMLRSVLAYELSQHPSLSVPDAVTAQREQLSSWTIPDTTLTLTALSSDQVDAGLACARCSRGDFLFSAQTLAQIPADFETIFAANDGLRRRFGADLYSYWALLPGNALPPKLFLLQPLALRRGLLTPLWGQSLLQWILLIPLTLLAWTAMGWWVWKLHQWQRQRSESLGVMPNLLGLLAVLPLLLLVLAWQWYAIDWINLFGARQAAVLVVVRLAVGLLEATLAYLLAETLGQLIAQRRCRDNSGALVLERRKGAGQILTLARVAGLLAAVVVLIRTGQDLGLTSLTLLGLASVPALAISLGTQQLIRDIADGFSLLLDGQLLPGDRCTIGTSKSGAIQGEITSLGMRSLRILQEDGSIVSLPNSQVAGSVVTNHRLSSVGPFKLSLPLEPQALAGVANLLEQARQVLADCPQLSEGRAELEATDQGWALKLGGCWRGGLGRAEANRARQELFLRLIQLTLPTAAAAEAPPVPD